MDYYEIRDSQQSLQQNALFSKICLFVAGLNFRVLRSRENSGGAKPDTFVKDSLAVDRKLDEEVAKCQIKHQVSPWEV